MKIKPVAALLWLAMSGTTQAALHDRGSGLIYDDVLNVTWLQDANYAKTSGYDADGKMAWSQAIEWAANLAYYDSVRNVVWDDWRLPTTEPVNGISMNYAFRYDGTSDYGYNIGASGTLYVGSKGSELAFMYYNNLGIPAGYDTTGNPTGCDAVYPYSCLAATTLPFINLAADAYWAGAEYAPNPTQAWWFVFNRGYQESVSKEAEPLAWAVRDGDVAAIPEAETYVMILVGLGLVSAATRWRRGYVQAKK